MLNLIFSDNDILIEEAEGHAIRLPDSKDVQRLKDKLDVFQDTEEIFVAHIHKKEDFKNLHTKLRLVNIRQALGLFDENLYSKLVYYLQLTHYYIAHKFCGYCGHALTKQTQNNFLICTHCGKESYPKLSPCIIVRVTRGEQMLMARGANFPPGIWALIAGFVELGESLEEAIHREIMEEVGIAVKNIRYWGSQSWPIPTSSLMVGFTAEYKRGEIKVDNQEIVEAGFFTKDNIPGIPLKNFSIARKMIDEFFE